MPAVIKIGSTVSGIVEPKRNKRKAKCQGTVIIASHQDKHWTVYWDSIQKCSHHPAQILKQEPEMTTLQFFHQLRNLYPSRPFWEIVGLHLYRLWQRSCFKRPWFHWCVQFLSDTMQGWAYGSHLLLEWGYFTKSCCTLQYKCSIKAAACKEVPGCGGWLKKSSSSVWMN